MKNTQCKKTHQKNKETHKNTPMERETKKGRHAINIPQKYQHFKGKLNSHNVNSTTKKTRGSRTIKRASKIIQQLTQHGKTK